MCVYLRAKCQVSSIILTSFRQDVILLPKPQNEPLKISPRLGINSLLPKDVLLDTTILSISVFFIEIDSLYLRNFCFWISISPIFIFFSMLSKIFIYFWFMFHFLGQISVLHQLYSLFFANQGNNTVIIKTFNVSKINKVDRHR